MRFSPAIKLMVSAVAVLVTAASAIAASRPAGNRGAAEYLGSYTWHSPQDWFGGFSALEIAKNGHSMTVLSDRATIARVSLRRKDGLIAAAEIKTSNALKASTGKRLTGRIADSEGLAVATDGSICISYEGLARVACQPTDSGKVSVLPRIGAFKTLPSNKSLEALAIDHRGHLFTLPEGGTADDPKRIPIWRWDGNKWSQPFSLPQDGSFLPVSADFGPDGKFYLLERSFGIFGFRSRLRRWTMADAQLDQGETLLQTAPGTHDNLEGLSVWRDDTGRLRATMVSDDNFNLLQKTELVEYALPG